MSTGRAKQRRASYDLSDMCREIERSKVKRRLTAAFNGAGPARVRIADDIVPPETTRKGKKP